MLKYAKKLWGLVRKLSRYGRFMTDRESLLFLVLRGSEFSFPTFPIYSHLCFVVTILVNFGLDMISQLLAISRKVSYQTL